MPWHDFLSLDATRYIDDSTETSFLSQAASTERKSRQKKLRKADPDKQLVKTVSADVTVRSEQAASIKVVLHYVEQQGSQQ